MHFHHNTDTYAQHHFWFLDDGAGLYTFVHCHATRKCSPWGKFTTYVKSHYEKATNVFLF